MKVSVVIPAYNEEKFISRCLEALVHQSVPADEVIVVDNNSTDKTALLAGRFNEVTVVPEPTQGIIPARNRGFEQARGDIIARCDADCIVRPDWIAKIKKDFTAYNPIDALVGTAVFYDFPLRNIKPVITNSIRLIRKRTGFYPLFGSNMAIRKASWNEIKDELCMDEQRIFEDLDISIHLHAKKKTIWFDNELIVGISARRLKKYPFQILVGYPYKIGQTLRDHTRITSSAL